MRLNLIKELGLLNFYEKQDLRFFECSSCCTFYFMVTASVTTTCSLPSGLNNKGLCSYEGFSLHRLKFYSPDCSDILFNVTLSVVEGPLKRFSEKTDETLIEAFVFALRIIRRLSYTYTKYFILF